MSKKRFLIDPRQRSIFDYIKESINKSPAIPGDSNIHLQLKACLSEVLRRSRFSRYQVAARMGELLGVEISKTTLDTWTAESKENHRIPAEYIPAFCLAAESIDPLDLLARKARAFIFQDADALRAEIQRFDEQIRELQAEKRKRRLFIEAQSNARKEAAQ